MDSTDWERILSRIRSHQVQLERIQAQWQQLSPTPGWAGPTEQAAWSQVDRATASLRTLADTLQQAEDEAVAERARAREREAKELSLL